MLPAFGFFDPALISSGLSRLHCLQWHKASGTGTSGETASDVRGTRAEVSLFGLLQKNRGAWFRWGLFHVPGPSIFPKGHLCTWAPKQLSGKRKVCWPVRSSEKMLLLFCFASDIAVLVAVAAAASLHSQDGWASVLGFPFDP